jgi:uncharacterized membrane protein
VTFGNLKWNSWLVLLFVGLNASFVTIALARYFALGSFFADLGIFQTWLNNVGKEGETGRIFFGHAHVAAFLYLAILKGIPDILAAPTIVTLQAVALVTPLWFLYRRYGRIVAIAFSLYVPLWINNHFDFHFDHLAVPLLLWFFLSATSGRPVWATVAALLLMTVKEPFALQAMACGAFLVWMGFRLSPNSVEIDRYRFILSGLALVVTGGGYFYFATHSLIPYFSGGGQGLLDGDAFSWMGHSLGQMLGYLVMHPLDVLLEVVSTPGKLIYLFVVFGLLAFIPLLAPSYLIPALPLLAIAMLSRLPNYYDYNTHYTAGLIVPAMFAFIHGLPKAHALWTRGAKWVWRKAVTPHADTRPHSNPLSPGEGIYLSGGNAWGSVWDAKLSKAFYVLLALWILAGHIMLSPSPISRLFWSDKVWSYSWRAYVPTERETMMKDAMLKYIPADPEVSVTTQNTVNWYHLAHRKVYAPFPHGIEEPIRVMDWSSRSWGGFWRFVRLGEMSPAVTYDRYADYVVLDLKRPWFIVDKGCEWIYGGCRNKEKAREFLDLVARTRARYETLFEHDGFMILRRR